jgi:hypothetical protein
MAAAVTALAAFRIGGPAQAVETELVPLKSAAQVAPPSGPSVMAAVPARNVKNILLKFPPPKGAVSCVGQTIYLAADTYYWQTDNSETAYIRGKQIYLAAGNYRWVDCIRTHEYTQDSSDYEHRTSLQKVSTGAYASPLTPAWIRNGSDTGYAWKRYGSKLTRL